ncbi:MAG TPA: hypothetical protein P5180_10945, partial [Bacteroidales bacterium]|nr:hypothetical protein [Bacteroidales bacterium]
MTESKKKTSKKDVVDKEEEGVKPVKKAKIKEIEEKLIEEEIEEAVSLSNEDEVPVDSETEVVDEEHQRKESLAVYNI